MHHVKAPTIDGGGQGTDNNACHGRRGEAVPKLSLSWVVTPGVRSRGGCRAMLLSWGGGIYLKSDQLLHDEAFNVTPTPMHDHTSPEILTITPSPSFGVFVVGGVQAGCLFSAIERPCYWHSLGQPPLFRMRQEDGKGGSKTTTAGTRKTLTPRAFIRRPQRRRQRASTVHTCYVIFCVKKNFESGGSICLRKPVT